MQILIVMLIATVCVSAGETMLSAGMKQIGGHEHTLVGGVVAALRNPWAICGTFLMMLYFGLYSFALSRADISLVLPLTALSYLFVALLARYVLHESVSPTRWLGAAIITMGVLVVAAGMRPRM